MSRRPHTARYVHSFKRYTCIPINGTCSPNAAKDFPRDSRRPRQDTRRPSVLDSTTSRRGPTNFQQRFVKKAVCACFWEMGQRLSEHSHVIGAVKMKPLRYAYVIRTVNTGIAHTWINLEALSHFETIGYFIELATSLAFHRFPNGPLVTLVTRPRWPHASWKELLMGGQALSLLVD